jgi:type I site-specific restriction-modification system R (restriction) subunit
MHINQFQTYKNYIPGLFIYNELLVISDGLEARGGTITSGWTGSCRGAQSTVRK